MKCAGCYHVYCIGEGHLKNEFGDPIAPACFPKKYMKECKASNKPIWCLKCHEAAKTLPPVCSYATPNLSSD